MMKKFLRSKNILFGGIIIITLILLAVFAPLFAPYDPVKDLDLTRALEPPGRAFLMGTDPYGRDLLSRVIYGTRISFTLGLIIQTLNTIIGVSLGLCAGYFGGKIDDMIMGLTNIMLSIPTLILALTLMVVMGPGIINLIIALGFVSWTYTCRVTRAETLSIKERQFIEAARASGVSNFRIIRKHILPNILSPILVIATLGIGGAILMAATLGFLGLGAQPPSPEWGAMLSSGRDYIWAAPWLCVFPGLAIFITVLGLNLLGDGLRDILDPRLITKKYKN